MFASLFNDPGPSARAVATLAFSGCLWLAGAATAETPSPEAALNATLVARFGALEWSGDDRYPMPCDDAEGVVYRAEALDGLWATPAPFLQVEGRLAAVYQGRDRWFLNFGEDYRADFSAPLQGRALQTVRRYWPDPESWLGREVRIFGYVDTWNGLFIEWDFPGQFCFVDPIPDSA